MRTTHSHSDQIEQQQQFSSLRSGSILIWHHPSKHNSAPLLFHCKQKDVILDNMVSSSKLKALFRHLHLILLIWMTACPKLVKRSQSNFQPPVKTLMIQRSAIRNPLTEAVSLRQTAQKDVTSSYTNSSVMAFNCWKLILFLPAARNHNVYPERVQSHNLSAMIRPVPAGRGASNIPDKNQIRCHSAKAPHINICFQLSTTNPRTAAQP